MTNFMRKCDEPGELAGVVVNDCSRPAGRPINEEKLRRLNGQAIRDNHRQALLDRNMYRPIVDREEWDYDSNNHVIIT